MEKVREELLVARCKRGDQDAFAELVSIYEKKVFNIAYRMTDDPEDAKDLAQEAFLRVYTALPSFRFDSSFSTWLYRIVCNVCLDEIRRKRRKKTVYLNQPRVTDEGETYRQLVDSSDGPSEIIEREELQRAVIEGINALSEDYRMVVVLRDLQGMSYEEIAVYLNISLGTVKSRLNRARTALKQRLSGLELFKKESVQRCEGREMR